MLFRSLLGVFFLSVIAIQSQALGEEAVVTSEFIYETAPFPSCHASTLLEVAPGHILAAWFGGTDEGEPDVAIWISHRKDGKWSAPVEVARHDGVPCWNPVLWKDNQNGEIQLWYKAGTSPETWSGYIRRSTDGGANWSARELLPAGILGPVRSKPYQLEDGTLLCGSSAESYMAWGVWCEITADGGKSWSKGSPINVEGNLHGVIQPSIFQSGEGRLRMLMRARPSIGKLCQSDSTDGGKTWTPAVPTALLNPNAGADAVNIDPNNVALIYNPTTRTEGGRALLNIGLSKDGGDTWKDVVSLENDPGHEYSYPAIIFTSDGMLAATYTWRREKVRFVLLDPKKF